MRRLLSALLVLIGLASAGHAQELLAPQPIQHFTDNNGNPCVGCQLFTYSAGTTTKRATFTDATGGTPNTNPIVMNARGEANVWIPPSTAYKFVLTNPTAGDPPTSSFWTVDQITASGGGGLTQGTFWAGTSSGSFINQVLAAPQGLSSISTGTSLTWKQGNQVPISFGTGATVATPVTLAVTGLITPTPVLRPDGTPLVGTEIPQGGIFTTTFSNGNWYLQNPNIPYWAQTFVIPGFQFPYPAICQDPQCEIPFVSERSVEYGFLTAVDGFDNTVTWQPHFALTQAVIAACTANPSQSPEYCQPTGPSPAIPGEFLEPEGPWTTGFGERAGRQGNCEGCSFFGQQAGLQIVDFEAFLAGRQAGNGQVGQRDISVGSFAGQFSDGGEDPNSTQLATSLDVSTLGNIRVTTGGAANWKPGATFSGSISGNTLTVASSPTVFFGFLKVGDVLTGTGIAANTAITAPIPPAVGFTGTYTISGSPQTVALEPMVICCLAYTPPFPDLPPRFLIGIDSEAMWATYVDDNTINITARAQAGTLAQPHVSGAPVIHYLTQGQNDAIGYNGRFSASGQDQNCIGFGCLNSTVGDDVFAAGTLAGSASISGDSIFIGHTTGRASNGMNQTLVGDAASSTVLGVPWSITTIASADPTKRNFEVENGGRIHIYWLNAGSAVTAQMGATSTGTASGTNLTLSSTTGIIHPGTIASAHITGTGVPANTFIASQTSGTTGGDGVYVTNQATTASAAAITDSTNVLDVTAVTSGTVSVGGTLAGSEVPGGTTITALGVAGAGGVGDYITSDTQENIASEAMTTVSEDPGAVNGWVNGQRINLKYSYSGLFPPVHFNSELTSFVFRYITIGTDEYIYPIVARSAAWYGSCGNAATGTPVPAPGGDDNPCNFAGPGQTKGPPTAATASWEVPGNNPTYSYLDSQPNGVVVLVPSLEVDDVSCFGANSLCQFSDSTGLGFQAQTTAAHQVMLGGPLVQQITAPPSAFVFAQGVAAINAAGPLVGMVANGTDQSSALQAALNTWAGKVCIYIPTGRMTGGRATQGYTFTQAVLLPTGYCIFGDGPWTSELDFTDTTGLAHATFGATVSNGVLRNLYLKGNADTTSNPNDLIGIYLGPGNSWQIENVRADDFSECLRIESNTLGAIRGNIHDFYCFQNYYATGANSFLYGIHAVGAPTQTQSVSVEQGELRGQSGTEEVKANGTGSLTWFDITLPSGRFLYQSNGIKVSLTASGATAYGVSKRTLKTQGTSGDYVLVDCGSAPCAGSGGTQLRGATQNSTYTAGSNTIQVSDSGQMAAGDRVMNTGSHTDLHGRVIIASITDSTHITVAPIAASFRGSIAGTTLTVTSMTSGYLTQEQTVSGSGVTGGTLIRAQTSGQPGQAGTYTVTASQTVALENLTASLSPVFVSGSSVPLQFAQTNVANCPHVDPSPTCGRNFEVRFGSAPGSGSNNVILNYVDPFVVSEIYLESLDGSGPAASDLTFQNMQVGGGETLFTDGGLGQNNKFLPTYTEVDNQCIRIGKGSGNDIINLGLDSPSTTGAYYGNCPGFIDTDTTTTYPNLTYNGINLGIPINVGTTFPTALTIASSQSGDSFTATYTSQVCTGVRTGAIISYVCTLSFTPSFSASTGNLIISGIPYNALGANQGIQITDLSASFVPPSSTVSAGLRTTAANASTLNIYSIFSGGNAAAPWTVATLSDGVAASISFSGTYQIAY